MDNKGAGEWHDKPAKTAVIDCDHNVDIFEAFQNLDFDLISAVSGAVRRYISQFYQELLPRFGRPAIDLGDQGGVQRSRVTRRFL